MTVKCAILISPKRKTTQIRKRMLIVPVKMVEVKEMQMEEVEEVEVEVGCV
jgi:hypothetical protein